ncbi:conserved Plasmodium protein, unknown function [Plasmodium knowlesi strain H]|uniref:Nucleolar protein 10 n=3 Tax=Plasmodium knowlesi TaxID=5850 RepID=A0A5K1VLW4_PLAKH|nr:uncharacterized protein PKNH_0117400 [Plasmodium knowlesi strain H]OTN68643.1 Uncharacterized protein PKNOH_S01025900 [Plasmodium knowlesi]CAA9986255.1 nucleolar protein 10, putative [Plasmodium knowlesi strain H]SBO25465.1 conserved Plasmodium protein, unknown function [Plasmodium knowlesi strain H]SBO27743.1 conserved Plasmodium protein, unknown function [Plasmodium knowlesi strain H]VVS75729.1 nucleolar protein 10, putative [Plasmodium knowlesi strain H]|eukprot:XP_002257664.1 [Plasmodium knowlesi strain H]
MIKSFINNGIKIYSLTSGRVSPENGGVGSVGKGSGRKKKNESIGKSENSVEILHDLEFSQKSEQVKISDDGRYICISGMYPPQVGLYDTKEMSIKHRRHFDEEVVNFEFLTSNYEKLAFLCKNRHLEFHNAAGKYYKMRIPKEGRNLLYNKENSNLYICSSFDEIYVLNLHKGGFEHSMSTRNEHNNFLCRNMHLPIMATGGSTGFLEIWDERVKKSISCLEIHEGEELTAGCFSDSGLKLGVGTEKGIVKMYDIRHSRPLLVKDHCNDLAIKKIEFVNIGKSGGGSTVSVGGGNGMFSNDRFLRSGDYGPSVSGGSSSNEYVTSADANCIKIYSERDPNLLTFHVMNRQSESGKSKGGSKKTNAFKLLGNDTISINSFTFYKNSGLCFIPCDSTNVSLYFIPYIGIAPKWCNFLDNITEELEEREKYDNNRNDGDTQYATSNDLFDDYVFVSNEQVERMNISHLRGTPNLISYLHGYYMPSKLYTDIKSVFEADNLNQVKKAIVQRRLEKKQQMRIPDRSVMVNRDYVDKLLTRVNKKVDKKQKAIVEAQELLQDERFSKLFYDPEYMVETVDLGDNPG